MTGTLHFSGKGNMNDISLAVEENVHHGTIQITVTQLQISLSKRVLLLRFMGIYQSDKRRQP